MFSLPTTPNTTVPSPVSSTTTTTTTTTSAITPVVSAEKTHGIAIDEPSVAHQAILFILDVLIRNNQAMPIVKLYDSFADRTFTPQMLRAVGGNEQGLQQFLLRYPSLFTVNNDTVSANSATPVRTINSSKSHHNKNKSIVSSASNHEANETISGTETMTTLSTNETVWDAKTMREIEQEAINFFKKQLFKREEEWLPIVSVAGHASQASADVRKYVGPQNEFKVFLLRYPNIFIVRDEFCGLKGKADLPGVPFPPPSPPPKRRITLSNNNNMMNGSGNNLMLTRSTSFKSGTRPIIGGNNNNTNINNNSIPNTPTNNTNSSMLLSSSSSSGIASIATPTITRNTNQRLTSNEVKAVHYVMRLLHKSGRILLQNVPGLIARAPDHLAQLIGFTRDDLITFFKRHNAIFQLHTDGTVSVKFEAVRALLNKNDNSQTSSLTTPTTITTQLSQQPTSITTSGVVIRIFPKYGILNMDNNEQVFFDIQSCHFETFNDLTCVLNPGDSMNFNAILGPKEGSTKWKSLKTWPRQNNRPAQLMTPMSSSNSNSSISHIVHSASTNNLSSISSSNGGYISPPSFDHYSTTQYQNSQPSNGYAPIDQDLHAYQMSNDINGGLDETIDNNTNGNQSPPMSLMNSTSSNRHSRLGLPTLDEEQCPLPKMAGGLDAEVLRRNLQQVVQRKNAISLREQADETGRYVSQDKNINASDIAKRLYEDLMRDYDKRVRPVYNANDALNVAISLSVTQLIDVDEKRQIITTNVWLKHEWFDYRLKWNSSLYDNICIMHMASEELWLPDIVLYNNADGAYQVTSKTKAFVYPSGAVVWNPPMIYKSSCSINVQYFPFDEQVCSLKFGSWTHDGNQLNLSHIVYNNIEMTHSLNNYRSQGVFFHNYYPNGEWEIIHAPAKRNQKSYTCCLEPYYDITYILVLKRKTLFYIVHLIIPCVGISLLTLIVFYLPSQSGEKIVLCISIELALTVFFPLLADLIPSTSIIIPLLGKYLLFIMILVALSILNAIVTLAFYYREQNQKKSIPKWMKYFFINILPPLLFLPSIKQDKVKKFKQNKRKYWMKLPQDNTYDAIFMIMLEKLLHLTEIEKIFSKFNRTVNKNKNAHDWHYVALVFDRILLIIFTIVSLTGTIVILAQRFPNTVSNIDLNNLNQGVFDACSYQHQH
ncbi:unnamed protein product [Rotaria sp. Silwood1]|nr:unnamed protein product [Rotaria sp. Silwood1]